MTAPTPISVTPENTPFAPLAALGVSFALTSVESHQRSTHKRKPLRQSSEQSQGQNANAPAKASAGFISASKIPPKANSATIMGILDALIAQAVKPLWENTNYPQRCLWQHVYTHAPEKRYKFGGNGGLQGRGASLARALLTGDWNLFQDFRTERSTTLAIAGRAAEALTGPEIMASEKQALLALSRGASSSSAGEEKTEELLGRSQGTGSAFVLGQRARAYAALAQELISEIYIKYAPLVERKTRIAGTTTALQIDKTHLRSNLYVGVGRAIDRCDVEKGTLTAAVQAQLMCWFNSPEYGHAYGEAYKIDPSARRERVKNNEELCNFAVPLTPARASRAVSGPAELKDPAVLRGLAALPGTSLALVLLGAAPPLSPEQKARLRQSAHTSASPSPEENANKSYS